MDNNITWKKVFVSFFIKDLVYVLLGVTIIMSMHLLFRRAVGKGLDFRNAINIVETAIPIIASFFIFTIGKMRRKENDAIEEFLDKKFDEGGTKSPNPSFLKGPSSFKFVPLLLLHLAHIIFLIWAFYALEYACLLDLLPRL